MNAMIDARCSKCQAAIGWCGTMADMPACNNCGHRPPQTKLDAATSVMEEARRLNELAPHKATGDELRRQRIASGLNLRMAAKHIGVTPSVLSGWEQGIERPDERSAAIIANVYEVGPKNS